MARRRRRKEPSGAEAVFGMIAGGVALLYLGGASLSDVVFYAVGGITILLCIALAIWFIHGLIESSKPIDRKTGKPRTKQSSISQHATALAESPTAWTAELIAKLEWRVFERLCIRLWEEKGFIARETGAGADGGVDFYLHAQTTNQKIGAVQCKSWNKKQIGVNVLRELQGVVASEQLKLGLLMYSGKLSKAAIEFTTNPAVTVKAQGDAEIFAEIKKLPAEQQSKLLSDLTDGDYMTPSCPNCDVKLVERTAKKTGRVFWGCANFPRCRHVMN